MTRFNECVSFIKGSFDDKGVMQSALEYVDTVFHLAAVGMTGQYAHNRKACMDINAIGTMNLLDWSKQFGVKRFIYTSSIGVIFQGEPLENADENVPYPLFFYNYYCESKAHAERIVRQASSERMKCSVLRFNGIYGPGEKRVTERVKNFMISGWWIACCKPDGVEAQTQLSSVDNCVHGLLRAEITLRNCDAPHAQIYNIMDPEPVGTFSFWSPLNEALGFSCFLVDIPSHVLRSCGYVSQVISNILRIDPIVSLLEVDLLLTNNTFNINKARRDLGYNPHPDSMPDIIYKYTSMTSLVLLIISAIALLSGIHADSSFKIDTTNHQFLLDDQPFRYLAGEIHYFRIPATKWEDRLKRVRSMGLNAITVPVPWNLHQIEYESIPDFTGNLDLFKFIQMAQDNGLYTLIRLGPYIADEWENGGLPWWLIKNTHITKYRSSNLAFIAEVSQWWNYLLPKLAPLMRKNGGPILMAQIEHYYGSTGICDQDYLLQLANLAKKYLGNDVVLYSGDTATILLAIRNFINNIPGWPNRPTSVLANTPRNIYSDVEMKPTDTLIDFVVSISTKCWLTESLPLTAEDMNQGYGFLYYQTNITSCGRLNISKYADDAYVYLNGNFVGALYNQMADIHNNTIDLQGCYSGENNLEILVEISGRSHTMYPSISKGLQGKVFLNDKIISIWNYCQIPIGTTELNIVKNYGMIREQIARSTKTSVNTQQPAIFTGTLTLSSDPMDTYIDTRGWGKGFITVNQYNIGRYWPTEANSLPPI
ncbi:unnamed protein product [Caenorhabditis sp. 36 PRJEB53466]|nr:unnamed protein product [Caenorhabditis sp. 36 PRJEB53466]